MKTIVFATIFCFSTVIAFSNDATGKTDKSDAAAATPAPTVTKHIQGKVIDKTTGEALAGVAIQLKGSENQIYTDFEGNFSINGITPGTYDLNVMFVSYQELTLKEIKTGNSAVKLKVELESVSPNN